MRRLFDSLEQARVESRVAVGLAGVRINLAAWHATMAMQENAALMRAARQCWNAPLWPREDRSPSEPDAVIVGQLQAMSALLEDQERFGIAALELLGSIAIDRRAACTESPTGDGARETVVSGAVDAAAETGFPDHGGRAAHAAPSAQTSAAPAAYRIYTQQFDRVVDASRLSHSSQTPLHRPEVAESRMQFQRWAQRLQRYLQVRAPRVWRFDEEEGQLDAARLTRLLTNPLLARPFKCQSPALEREAAITILLDCSGSMRGRVMATAVGCIQLLLPVLERCGVPVELLGFTTGAWRGGSARAHWVAAGRPATPGRLNDLLHIVFKQADVPWRRVRDAVAVLLEDAHLKENIDGEALLWASARLRRRPERRRILLVVSDGAPCDEETLKANDPDYLDRHLRAVIRAIEAEARIDLLAIGIGHDVGKHYARAFTVSGPADLGETIVTQLAALLGDSVRTGDVTGLGRVKGHSW